MAFGEDVCYDYSFNSLVFSWFYFLFLQITVWAIAKFLSVLSSSSSAAGMFPCQFYALSPWMTGQRFVDNQTYALSSSAAMSSITKSKENQISVVNHNGSISDSALYALRGRRKVQHNIWSSCKNGHFVSKNPVLQNVLAFCVYLLQKLHILTETPYKYVVFGTAAENLK